jgi:hypothetical protein
MDSAHFFFTVSVESVWTPGGLCTDSAQTPCGFVDSLWTPHGLHVDLWSPRGVHKDRWGTVKYRNQRTHRAKLCSQGRRSMQTVSCSSTLFYT